MKNFKFIFLISILLLFPAYSYPAALGFLRISLIDGDVQIKTEDTEEWVPASINMPLKDGDRIWVPEGGRTELQIGDGTSLRLDQKSALDILTIEKDSFQFYLTEGYVYANFRGLRDSLLQIDTPLSSVRSYDRSVFRIDISEDGYTNTSVYRGSVYAENRDGKTTIDEGNTLSLREGTYAELAPLGPPDEWEQWNSERDRKLAERRPASRYLPDELQPYSADFEGNGRWVNIREYGYVWTPTVAVSAGWAPYRTGRWVWMGGDYVWVSYEPWGWVPYHYGRWAFVDSVGWCWVPPVRGAVYWGPGFVGWVQTPTYVSWVPLAPGEIYYGHGYYGPHSVNITNINITHIDVTRVVYRNVHVRNGVTIVHHDTFVTGKHVDVKVRENPFLREKISIGRPNIKPERATFIPVLKEIPLTKRPPELIREIKVREIKEKRPLVKTKEASVLRPGSPPKEMTLKTKEGKPVERKLEREKVLRPTERKVERLKEPKPLEKEVEKPKELKPVERGLEKPKEYRPTEKGVERPREFKPVEKGVEKPKEFKATEKGVERPRELSLPEKGVEKPKEFKPREIEKPKEKPVERGLEKARERKPVEKETEKVKERRKIEKEVEKTKEHKPAEKE